MSVVVIGGGQAGLAVSHELWALGIEHVVLERDRVAETWRGRWDSFRLVTPNWTLDLPGAPYAGDDPDGFAPRDEIVDYLEQYAADLPVRTGIAVDGLEPGPTGGFLLRTSGGQRTADAVIVCTGAYQRPYRPPFGGEFPRDMAVLDAEGYRTPAALPAGRVLVVGSGQTGCQIAEELCQSGREVLLACGRAPWGPRRPAGRDIVTWLNETTWFRTPVSALPAPAARLFANIQTTGKDGGHDLHYRTLQAMGVELVGRLAGVDGHHVRFADDLAESVAWGDARDADIGQLLAAQLGGRRRTGPTRHRSAPTRLSSSTCAGSAQSSSRLVFAPTTPTGSGSNVRLHGLPNHRRRGQHSGLRAILLRRPLPAHPRVVAPVWGGGGRHGRRPRGGQAFPLTRPAGRRRFLDGG